MDVGAHDGKTYNNTLFFEEAAGWTGLNVEANPIVFKELEASRPRCINVNCAVSEQDGSANFIHVTGPSEMLSGLQSTYDPRHAERLASELKTLGGESKVIPVPTRRLDTLFREHGINYVHYLSIDVEGAELSVLKSIDFSKVYIDVIGFEQNYEDSADEVIAYLRTRGYVVLHGGLDVFMIHHASLFR